MKSDSLAPTAHVEQQQASISQPTQLAGVDEAIFVDARPEAMTQQRLQAMAKNSPQTRQMKAMQAQINTGSYGNSGVIQCALWTSAEFTTATTFEKTFSTDPRERKSIVVIDNALKAVHDNLVPAGRIGLLQDLVQAIDEYLELKVLGKKHTTPFEWRGKADASNERIDPTLTLKQQVLDELRGGRNVVHGINWDLHDEMVQATSDLARLKTLVSQRFGIAVADIGAVPIGGTKVGGTGKVTTAHDWTLKGLKRAYQALTSLPLSHAEANASLGKFQRYEGGGGYFAENSATVAIGSRDDRLEDNYAGGTAVGVAGSNSFEWTVRHEIGHAVADKVGAVAGYCATDPGGHWTDYGHNREVDFVEEVFACSNGIVHAILAEGVAAGMMRYTAAQVAQKEITMDDAIATIMNYVPSLPINNAVTAQQIAADPGWAVLNGNLEAVWSGGARLVVGGRGFVKSSERGFASFQDASFARKVSAYQFRSPHEWFAEAYAAYHDPRFAPGTLLAGDPATRAHIAAVV